MKKLMFLAMLLGPAAQADTFTIECGDGTQNESVCEAGPISIEGIEKVITVRGHQCSVRVNETRDAVKVS